MDILVNNAGITRHARDHSDLDALSKDDFLDTYAVNVVGPYLMLQATKPLLEAAYRTTGRASTVLNTSSIAGIQGIGSSVAYAASKGGLLMFMKSLAQEVAHQKIRVNAISPGAIRTDINRSAWETPEAEADLLRLIPYERVGDPMDIGHVAVWLASDASDYVTGTTIYADGGMTLYPGFREGG